MPNRERTELIVIHCSATKPDQDIGFEEIDDMHRVRGWLHRESGIHCGYHMIIRRDGSIELGRPWQVVGAHAYGHNQYSFAVVLIGGLKQDGTPGSVFLDSFTDEQAVTLRKSLQFLQLLYPFAKVLGHRDLSPDTDGNGVISASEWIKFCPCFDVVSFTNG